MTGPSLYDQYLASQKAPPPAPGSLYDQYLAAKAAPDGPGVLNRAATAIGGFAQHAIHHPIDTATDMLMAPIKSIAVAARASAEQDAQNAISQSGGPDNVVPRTVTPKEAAMAGLQTLANVAFPEVSGLGSGVFGRVMSTMAAGAATGAAYNPDDPGVGALVGGLTAPLAKGAAEFGGKATTGALDTFGRPAETRALVKVGPMSMGTVQGVGDRAASMNTKALSGTPAPDPTMTAPTGKPLAPVDMSIAAQRIARGLKTASPAAETVFRDALQPRADNAVERVIQHGLETTGLVNRENGLTTVDNLIDQRAADANDAFPKVFAAHPEPMTDPAFGEIAQTPAGQQAVKRGSIIAANRGEKIATTQAAPPPFDPKTLNPDQQGLYAKLLAQNGNDPTIAAAAFKSLGHPLQQGEAPAPTLSPTLQQAHYIKLGFDDMLNSAPEPGSGGTGPNNAAAIKGLKTRWLAAMDQNAPDYQAARGQFADQSDLIRAAQLGQNLWKTHPAEAAKSFGAMSTAEQDVARRTGFDALAERIENGPTDVERGVSKPRDQQRMRLLFPDDASFQQFKTGLAQEAQMHATTQGVLGGSNTADKLSDMAAMAGVNIPDVLRAAAGNPMPIVRKGAAAVLRKVGNQSMDELAAARAKELVKGANGLPASPSMAAPSPAAPAAAATPAPMNRRLQAPPPPVGANGLPPMPP